MNYKDESFLVNSLKKGDEVAYLYLVEHYHRKLFGYAITLTSDYHMAEDILQNVFLRLWERRKKLKISTSLQNYLYRSTHNEFINQYKKQKSTMLLEKKYFDSLARVARTQEENQIENVIAIIVKEIQNLPPKCREVFKLSREEGLTNLEISEHLDISVKTVEAQITKAFKTLRQNLGDKNQTFIFLLLNT